MQKILVVEDDGELNRGICYVLQKEGYGTASAHSVSEAETIYLQEDIRLAILDVNLPDGDGFALCKGLRKNKQLPVLFLTARDLEEDALRGYELGAEDYVTKPFSMKILLKKIGVILHRSEAEKPDIFDDGFLRVDMERVKVTVKNEECPVTPTEFRLLRELIANSGQLLTYDILLQRLWDSGGQFVDRHALAVNVNRLRRKIENGEHKYISNVYGMGYQWLK